MDKKNKTVFVQMVILLFITIWTRTILERNFGFLESIQWSGFKFVIIDFVYFSVIALFYVAVYYVFSIVKSRFM
jgi:hypothetical protein